MKKGYFWTLFKFTVILVLTLGLTTSGQLLALPYISKAKANEVPKCCPGHQVFDADLRCIDLPIEASSDQTSMFLKNLMTSSTLSSNGSRTCPDGGGLNVQSRVKLENDDDDGDNDGDNDKDDDDCGDGDGGGKNELKASSCVDFKWSYPSIFLLEGPVQPSNKPAKRGSNVGKCCPPGKSLDFETLSCFDPKPNPSTDDKSVRAQNESIRSLFSSKCASNQSSFVSSNRSDWRPGQGESILCRESSFDGIGLLVCKDKSLPESLQSRAELKVFKCCSEDEFLEAKTLKCVAPQSLLALTDVSSLLEDQIIQNYSG